MKIVHCTFAWLIQIVIGVVALELATSAGEPLDVRGADSDRVEIQRLLRGFHPQGDDLRVLERHIRNLDSDEFLARDRAMRDLLRLPIIPPDLLANMSSEGSTEVRLATRRLQRAQSASKTDRLLQSAYATILRRRWGGLSSELLDSLRFAGQVSTRRLGQRALAATVDGDDVSVLRSALNHDSPIVRRAAAMALSELLGDKSIDDLLPMVRDRDAKVRLEVAVALVNLGRQEALGPLVELLEHDVFLIRWQASEVLVASTGESLDYRPAAQPSARRAGVEGWRTWLAKTAPSCKLTFPVELPTQLRLFNGQDFTGWVAYTRELTEPEEVWSVHDGLLTTKAKQIGDLRTRDAFGDYRLSFQWRMPSAAGDSGIGVALVDASSQQPIYLEVQLHPNNSGDLYVIGGLHAKSGGEPIDSRAAKWGQSNERYRQWNDMEIVVRGGSVTVAVNGEIQNEAHECPVEPSHIMIRNQGSVVQFSNIVLTPLE